MGLRLSREERLRQVTEAALELLATSPVERLTTRALARKVGMTQPGLFRHFRSRDQILEAVIAHAQSSLARIGEGILEQDLAPLEAAEALARAVMRFAADNPGVPRLLFHDIGSGEEASFHRPLRQLVSMQRSLLGALVQAAVDDGAVPASVDSQRAAELGLACIQGLLLKWQLGGRSGSLEPSCEAFVAHWIAGLRAGQPAKAADATKQPEPAASSPVLAIDVRPILAGGTDPADQILALLARVPDDGLLQVIAPFRPGPLLALMASRGRRTHCEELPGKVWIAEVFGETAPEVVDLRDLEAPEPLEQVLLGVTGLAKGAAFIARVPRFPRLLIPHLEQQGLVWQVHEEPDGSVLVHVRRPP